MSHQRHGFSTFTWVVIGTIILIVGGFAYLIRNQSQQFAKLSNREVALLCTSDMATQFHIHPNLQLVINGQPQTIPANIGVKPGCMNALHTHDTSGKIHVESPTARDFTLADFFAVWEKTFNKGQILDNTTDESHVIRMTVNGQESQEFENLVFKDGDQIEISFEQITQ
jgi:hypothetical protein